MFEKLDLCRERSNKSESQDIDTLLAFSLRSTRTPRSMIWLNAIKDQRMDWILDYLSDWMSDLMLDQISNIGPQEFSKLVFCVIARLDRQDRYCALRNQEYGRELM